MGRPLFGRAAALRPVLNRHRSTIRQWLLVGALCCWRRTSCARRCRPDHCGVHILCSSVVICHSSSVQGHPSLALRIRAHPSPAVLHILVGIRHRGSRLDKLAGLLWVSLSAACPVQPQPSPSQRGPTAARMHQYEQPRRYVRLDSAASLNVEHQRGARQHA